MIILYAALACSTSGVKDITEYHDDAGFLVSEMQLRACSQADPCRIWHLEGMPPGPQPIAMGRDGVSKKPQLRLARFNLDTTLDGVIAIVHKDNPLLQSVQLLNCHERESCSAYVDHDQVMLKDEETAFIVAVTPL